MNATGSANKKGLVKGLFLFRKGSPETSSRSGRLIRTAMFPARLGKGLHFKDLRLAGCSIIYDLEFKI